MTPYAEGDWEVAPKRNFFFFQKITACFVFKIKSSFFSPFLVIGWILVCNVQKCSKMILSYIYMLSYVIAKTKIFIPLRIAAAVRQTAKDTEFNYFLCYSTLNCEHFGI